MRKRKKIETSSLNYSYDRQDTLTRAGIERLWKGVSKTNIGDIEELKSASQLKRALKKKGH